LNIREQDYGAEILGDRVQGGENVLVTDLVGDWGCVRQGVLQNLVRLPGDLAVEPLPPLMADSVKHDRKQPRSAVRSWLKAVEGLPGQQVGLLHDVLGFGGISEESRGRAEEIVQMRQGSGFETVQGEVLKFLAFSAGDSLLVPTS
jgi:hypothetical protein